MSLFLLLIARFLAASGVPAAVCGDELVIGTKCPVGASSASVAPASPPPPAPPKSRVPQGTYQAAGLDPLSISNGF